MSEPATILDVAQAVIEEYGEVSTMKLQKLCYFAYAWSLALNDEPLCTEPFEAWNSGPVSRRLYEMHVGQYEMTCIPGGDSSRLSADGLNILHQLHNSYGYMSGLQLSELSRRGGPWRQAYIEPAEGEHRTQPKGLIDAGRIKAYFTGLWAAREIRFPQPR